ncbi:plasmid maintenance system killer protein [Stenotrophomonas sp. CFBP8994]|nr:plasmid maintenance system killer protein [Stenotrophomonas sp. CFBP8994]MDY0979944.1 plasmid maintenance system killer protein [Stenotrophomonas sp. CFBP8994]
MLDAAQILPFLRSTPGNRVETAERGRRGQYTIRINAQWRLCFICTEAGPRDVESVD